MSGHVRQRGRSFEARLRGRDPVTGERRVLTRSAPTRAQAEALIESWLEYFGTAPPDLAPRIPVTAPPRRRRSPLARPRSIVRPASVRRLPLEPLLAAVGRPPKHRFADAVGVHAKQVYRWLEYGVTEVQADELACRLDLHPAIIWPDWAD